MYLFVKRLVKKIIPASLLVKQEGLFRSILTFFYQGEQHECNLCQTKLSRFVVTEKGDKSCPKCGSLDRNRRLFALMKAENLAGKRVLEFSPSRCLYRVWRKNKQVEYVATDFEDEFIADVKWDITALPSDIPPFDYIICYHILEHITEDIKAMQNLYRILAEKGKIVIQTPFKTGEIYENPSITSPEEREKHFGQHDHVRIYSAEGLKNRLESVGFQVKILTFNEKEDNYYGFRTTEQVLIATK